MTHTHTHTPTHTHTYHCVIDTLVIVTDTHKHIDCVLCTYMTSYLPQDYRLSILIDKQVLFINSWLIRLSIDNVLLINTPRLSILIDKEIPLSIDTSTMNEGTNKHNGHRIVGNHHFMVANFMTLERGTCHGDNWYR
jgi:hypothetical protein